MSAWVGFGKRWGCLDIHLLGPVDWRPNAVGEAIKEAEDRCSRMCEDCGAPHGLSIPRTGRAMCKECEALFMKGQRL